MAVRLRDKSVSFRELNFSDSDSSIFTARDFPDGRIEVTQHPRGDFASGTVVATFTTQDFELINSGWPSDS